LEFHFLRAETRFSATLSINSKVFKYLDLSTYIVPSTRIAKSFVICPDSTVSTITLSRVSQKLISS